jgi:hypothetical protein
MSPTLISDVGVVTYFVWQIGAAVTTNKKNTITVNVACDASGTLACLFPRFYDDLVK